ncbi:MAG: redox-sensing transcriptional repressor Rex [Spirochaetaceae bacterium]|nr:redox-sensing transcriptional repressor Rex [Spirochaetaceae bacterium]MDT8296858.1 redox-sensing transcriptional repressor Rex [Spirochaetaceae bacterium]
MTRIAQQAKRVSASIPTIRRLPSYLQVVRRYMDEGNDVISGTVIAEELDLEAIQVRKDLAVTGIVGKPRVGYPTSDLISAIEKFLNWDSACRAVIVGAGNLGSALMGYNELKNHGMNLVAAFDASPSRIGPQKNGPTIYPMSDIKSIVNKEKARLAILTVPPQVAQEVSDQLVDAGIRRIWNFTNVRLRVPEEVLVLREDLSSGYAVLTVLRGITD